MLILSKRPFASLFSLIAVCTFSGGKVSAESILWTGNSSNAFSIAENWNGANTPPQSDDSLVFGTSGAGTLNNDLTDSAFNVEGITFSVDAGTFVIGGNAFILTGDITNHSTSVQTINAPMILSGVSTFTTTASGGNILLGGVIDGGGQLVHQGSGILILMGSSTLGGGAVANNGTLQLGDGIHAAEQQGGAGTNGARGENGVIGWGDEPTIDGTAGGEGGAGANAFVVNAGGTLNLSSQTTVVAGTGGAGGDGGGLSGQYRAGGQGGPGGDAGAGGNAIVVNGGTLSSLPSQSTVIGGAGGNGGETGYFMYNVLQEPTELEGKMGGSGGAGGAAVLFTSAGSWTSSGEVIGGSGGMTGRGIDREASGGGGAGVIFSEGGALTNLGTITGGEGGLGGEAHSNREATGDTGKAGGNGGTGVIFGVSGSLVNSGVIEGGNGGSGGDYHSSPRSPVHSNVGGSGGDGGTAVTFDGEGSLVNSGTISGGDGGVGGVHFRGGVFDSYGATGSTGYGVLFSGGAGTLTNQSGGIINGGVVMGNFANDVTLETGSTITGGLDMGESTSSTLTLTGSGSQVWSAAITGATSFAGSLSKEGDGAWELDQAFHGNHTTRVNAGILLVNASLAGDATVENGATLGGAGHLGGDVIVRNGGTLSPGNSPGQMTIENNLIMESGSMLLLEFGGTSARLFDQLEVQGSFTAGGMLRLMLIDGFTPEAGATFTIFNGTTPGYDSGSFLFTTNLGGGLYWDTTDLADLGILTVIPEPSTYVLLGFGALAGILASRKRQQSA